MGRQMIHRDRRTISCNIRRTLFNRAIEAQAQMGYTTFTDFVERALEDLSTQVLGTDPIASQTRPQPSPKVKLALDDPVIEDPPIITTLVPKEEAIAVVDTSPRPYDPTKDDVMDYIKGKRS